MFYSRLLVMFGLWSFGVLVRVAGLLEKNSVDQQRCLAAVPGRVGITLTKLLQWLGPTVMMGCGKECRAEPQVHPVLQL